MSDILKKLVCEALAESRDVIIMWIKSGDKEYYGVQNQDVPDDTDSYYAVGWIDKGLLYSVNPGNKEKWDTIEPFYGEDFEKATEILLDYWKEKYDIEIGKRYELPGGLYGIEWYGSMSRIYNKKITLYLDSGAKIGNYFPANKTVSSPDWSKSSEGTFSLYAKVDNINKAAWQAYLNYKNNHPTIAIQKAKK